jgi:hypothetical protein
MHIVSRQPAHFTTFQDTLFKIFCIHGQSMADWGACFLSKRIVTSTATFDPLRNRTRSSRLTTFKLIAREEITYQQKNSYSNPYLRPKRQITRLGRRKKKQKSVCWTKTISKWVCFSLTPPSLTAAAVKISASQVWLGSYASSHLISSYIYVAYGHILAGTIKTINHISTAATLRRRST